MSTPEDRIAVELRQELDARLDVWRREREQLLTAVARVAELDALIAFAEDRGRLQFRVAPPQPPQPPPAQVPSDTQTPRTRE